MPGSPRFPGLLLFLVTFLPGLPDGVVPALAIGMHQDVPEADYLELASNSARFPVGPFPDFGPVAAVGVPVRGGKFEVIGSATLIAPRWALTAAHVVLSEKRGRDFEENLRICFGPATSMATQFFDVVEVITPMPVPELLPLLRSGGRYSERQIVHAEFNDLELLRLKESVEGITPARFDASDDQLLGKLVYIAGYGDAATGDNPRSRTWTQADKKRAAQNIIDREVRHNPYESTCPGGIILFDFDNGEDARNSLNLPSKAWASLFGTGQSSAVPTQMEGASYPGDSGGPAFAQVGGNWHLVAISGYGTGFPPDRRRTSIQYGDILVYTRIGPHAGWMQRVIAPGASLAKEPVVSRAEPVQVISEASATLVPSQGGFPPIFKRQPPAPGLEVGPAQANRKND